MIASAIRLARATSTTSSALVLVAFNVIPLIGVVFWGWNVATLLVLYWVENGIVGILNVPKMLLARGQPDPSEGELRINGRVSTSRAGMVVFFLIHYGIFWVVHGVFVFSLSAFAALTGGGSGAGAIQPVGPDGFGGVFPGPIDTAVTAGARGPDLSAVAWGALGLAISHGASFVINFLGRREYLRISAGRQMFAPYGRLVILHMAILLGAFVSLTIGSPIGALIVLVVLKTIVDLTLHLREHGVPIGSVRSA
ncbi:MAG TPA: DUF6498-containing protein [Candidatus Limnocylindrales bacterium]|nr:DUF6498-containing protein [Candidatus Limnocylindrales bacterium]